MLFEQPYSYVDFDLLGLIEGVPPGFELMGKLDLPRY
jgi:hypothetical protein